MTRKIIAAANYNGYGCINFKFAPKLFTQDGLDDYLRNLDKVHEGAHAGLTIEFGPIPDIIHVAGYEAVPKMFDFNARLCGTNVFFHQPEFFTMLRIYFTEVARQLKDAINAGN